MTRLCAGPGGAALLRSAALPLDRLALGAAPELTALLGLLAQRTAAYEGEAAELARLIGEQLVPQDLLTARQRAGLLGTRRALHGGSIVPPSRLADVAKLAESSLDDAGALPARIRALAEASAELSALGESAERQVAGEELRLLALPWRLLHASAAGTCALRSGDLTAYDDIAQRVAAGEPWTTKRMRQRSAYLWRMLTRAAANATPRGWLSHVSVLPVRQPGGWPGGGQLMVRERAATEVADNLDRSRLPRTEADSIVGDDEVTLVFSALVQPGPAGLRAWRIDGEGNGELSELSVRRTPLLDAVRAALTTRPRSGGELIDELAAGPARTRRRGRRWSALWRTSCGSD